ncbi:MAG TPA: hypothetical protein VK188_04755 [Holophaga sp.]|nr:hypothetical protein [Holophaga sp.]
MEFEGSTRSFRALHPVGIRRIKADGADFVRFVLKESRLESSEVDDAISRVRLGLFELDWVVPADASDPYRVTIRMDMLLNLFLVTGDQAPVHPVSQPLA